MAADIDPNLYIQAGAAFKTWHPSRKDATQMPGKKCQDPWGSTLAFRLPPEDCQAPRCWGTALLEQTWTHLWLRR